MSKRVFITGGTGFVGGWLKPALEHDAGYDVFLGPPAMDLRAPATVRSAIEAAKPDYVVHLAAQSFVGEATRDPRGTYDVNFFGTLNLLDALAAKGFRGRMLYVGSADAYGRVSESELPVVESAPLRPRNPYAVSKVAAEALCYQWSQTGTFEIVMARPFNHIGPGQSDRFAVSDFAKQIVAIKLGQREAIIQVGDIDVTRDFTDVRDVARAYRLLLERGVNGETYNVCSGAETKVSDVLKQLLAVAGVDAHIVQEQHRLRRSEQRRMCGSYAKLKDSTRWVPSVSLMDSLRAIVLDWETRLKND